MLSARGGSSKNNAAPNFGRRWARGNSGKPPEPKAKSRENPRPNGQQHTASLPPVADTFLPLFCPEARTGRVRECE